MAFKWRICDYGRNLPRSSYNARNLGTTPHRKRDVDVQHLVPPEHFIRLRIIDAVDANARLFIRYGFIALAAFFAYKSFAVVAGKHTFADIGVRLLANIKVANSIGYLVGGGGILYGNRQKKLREQTILNLAPGLRERELAADPNRSSSGLTERGGTRPEDEL